MVPHCVYMVEAHEMGTSMPIMCLRFTAPSKIDLEYSIYISFYI